MRPYTAGSPVRKRVSVADVSRSAGSQLGLTRLDVARIGSLGSRALRSGWPDDAPLDSRNMAGGTIIRETKQIQSTVSMTMEKD